MSFRPMEQQEAVRIPTRAPNNATYVERAKLHSVQQPNGCWDWFGCVSSGVPRVGRRSSDRRRGPINIRVALLEEIGPRPEWAYAAIAACGNPLCVNPEHLQWETKEDFFARVRRSMPHKISDDRYLQAWALHSEGMPVKELAVRFQVSRQTLYQNWKRLDLRKTTTFTPAAPMVGTADK